MRMSSAAIGDRIALWVQAKSTERGASGGMASNPYVQGANEREETPRGFEINLDLFL